MQTIDKLKAKLTGKAPYASNLLGESLPDLLRQATAKTLVTPDEVINQEVVDAIQQEAASGKDTKEIISLLKKRLRTDNPQKQWLGVLLVGKVLPDCTNVLGMHQEELLQEVARVMARPAKPETDAGKQARNAAKEVLRRFGRAGTTAFRAAQQDIYGRPGHVHTPASNLPHTGAYTAIHPPSYAAATGGYSAGHATDIERQSLSEEVQLLIDKARSNTELLSDMLVNSGQPGSDEFEKELIADLLTEVIELRGLFTAYLEQLQGQEGAEMEVLMVQALEAQDLLDGCIALQQDVSVNQEMPVATSSVSATAAAAPRPAPAQQGGDLIALDDLADGMGYQTSLGPAAPAYDPFAASTQAPAYSHAPAYNHTQASVPAPAPPTAAVGKSAFETMYADAAPAGAASSAPAYGGTTSPPPYGGAPTPYSGGATSPPAYGGAPAPYTNAPAYGGSPAQYTGPGGAQAPYPGQPGASPYGAPPSQPNPSPYQGQAGAPYPSYGSMPAQYPGQQPYGGAPQQQQHYGSVPQQQAQAPQYGMPQAQYGAPQPQYGAPPPQHGMAQASSNPFAPSASGAGGFMPPAGVTGPSATSNNPFGGSGAAPSTASGMGKPATQSTVDQEWDLFFADRAAGATVPH